MADPVLTAEEIAEAAKGAQSFTADGQSATVIPIKDQIEAAKFEAAQKSKKRQGLRFLRMVPPDARGGSC